jgi:Zn-dependent M28 family amino/carboxypeptidase
MKKTLLLTLAAALAFADENLTAEAARWWSHIAKLADDRMRGRDVGTPEYLEAAKYVSGEFEKQGLTPGAGNGYLQKVPMASQRIDEAASALALVSEAGEKPLTLGEHANIGVRGATGTKLEAEMVFVGYGTQIAEHHYDDLAGMNLKGKIAVYISGQPTGIPGPLVSHYQSASERSKALLAAGAIGTATIANPKTSDIPWKRSTLARLLPSMSVVSKGKEPALRASIAINPAHANLFFEGSGHTIEEIFELANAKKPLPRFALKPKVRLQSALQEAKVEGLNVVGVRVGSDPALKNEVIVVTAHLDHLGVNERHLGDPIYNGAMDNASGVASLIEVARRLKESGAALKRTVAFVAVTGEEKGLLGSGWYAENPAFGSLKGARIVADLNMDMYLPLFPLKALILLGVDESTLGDTAKKAAQAQGIEVWPDPAPERNSFIRSDQYSFIRRGHPALAFKFGYQKDTPEEKKVQGWLRERYHDPSDDLEQPVEKEAAAQYNRVFAAIVADVANGSEAPRWKDESFFKRFEKK